MVRGAKVGELADKNVGPAVFLVCVGFGYGSASNAMLMFKAAFIHTRAGWSAPVMSVIAKG